jgi:methylenetetrahydrofolate reductase (NADPH)
MTILRYFIAGLSKGKVMVRLFQKDILDPEQFIVTMELVPKAESTGRSIDMILRLAHEAHNDGRLSAVSITDNPGGHPSLSPDVLGKEILNSGMDVIVHFTCRDMNRMGIESRALQLRRMGMKNILALTGDYSGKGFGGEGAPVFDIDSVLLLCQLSLLNHAPKDQKDSDAFFLGCAVSPFKWTEPETYAQYYKLCKKISSGAKFIITQLGYDARKFQELMQFFKRVTLSIPALASIYFLTPKSARVMYTQKIPGAIVRKGLFEKITKEWEADPRRGYFAAVERAAKLAAICKGMGYKGIHICGIHRDFKTVKRILDKLAQIEHQWMEFADEFIYSQPNDFYMFTKSHRSGLSADTLTPQLQQARSFQKFHFKFLYLMHRLFFRFDSPYATYYKKICQHLDQNRFGYSLLKLFEDGFKQVLLSCRRCGDCGIEHVGFLCPESKCPKHIRNGACGGSRDGKCEVDSSSFCVWYLAYKRLATIDKRDDLSIGCVPPRMWELNNTSSWINFHLGRDHQSASSYIENRCTIKTCGIENFK